MGRSLKKGPYIAYHLLKKILFLNNNKKKQIIKTYSRVSTIIPLMIGHTISIYNGHKFISIYITDLLVGYKLGEFIPTRKFISHKKTESKIKK
jgi:small subunit ribosomal protein S19